MTKKTEPTAAPLRILIAGGGTGGHLFPGISIAEAFMELQPCDIRFVGTKRGLEAKVIPDSPFKLYTIPVSGLYRVGLAKKILTLLKLPVAFLKSLWILITFRLRLVIGIGGYASGPMLALSILLGKNTIIQEQNAYPGFTNRILGKHVRQAFIPFEHTRHLFKNPFVVGNPIRKAIKDASPATHQLPSDNVVISIVGGSQGAHIINTTVAAILPQLAASGQKIKIIHQTGVRDCSWLHQEYGKVPSLESEVHEFITDMVSLYRQSHLFICRSGSMINEIIAMGKASIQIPIAFSSGDHQKENAKVLSAAGAAIMIEEKDLSPTMLYDTIHHLLTSPDELIRMGENARKLYKGDSARQIVSAIQSHFKTEFERSSG